MSDPHTDERSNRELDLLLDASARYALGHVDGTAFVRWFAEVVPILCPEFAGAFSSDEPSRHTALCTLGRLLWNRMPLPDNGFRPRPLKRRDSRQALVTALV